jgi:hypothetical protein
VLSPGHVTVDSGNVISDTVRLEHHIHPFAQTEATDSDKINENN